MLKREVRTHAAQVQSPVGTPTAEDRDSGEKIYRLRKKHASISWEEFRAKVRDARKRRSSPVLVAAKRERPEEFCFDDDSQPRKRSQSRDEVLQDDAEPWSSNRLRSSKKQISKTAITPKRTSTETSKRVRRSSPPRMSAPENISRPVPCSSKEVKQQSTPSASGQGTAQSSSSASVPTPPKTTPMTEPSSLTPCTNDTLTLATFNRTDVLSEARLQRLTETDWVYILSRAQTCSREQSRADNLAAKEHEANTRIALLETQLAEAKSEREKLTQQLAPSSAPASSDLAKAIQSHLQNEKSLRELIGLILNVKSAFDKLWMNSKIYMAQKVWDSAEMEALVSSGATAFTKIDRIIKEKEARDGAVSGRV
ncbi:hypothetical protein PRK78_003076 [Emydomyces testavorans]|uniref:Uncharacterized protein n=1 Tax=Emydomyces testavorans TaxID=2070801 RepID=A0AAF0DFF2_9EURO|nr:hypothetical protein PRK78_003076 [Emydomyces testavorans]